MACSVLLPWAVRAGDEEIAASHISPESGVMRLVIPRSLGWSSFPSQQSEKESGNWVPPAMFAAMYRGWAGHEKPAHDER